MNDYSDLIFLMGAMIIFSLLSVQTSRMFQMNDKVQMEAEIEYNAVSIAQNEIDKIRWIETEALDTHKNNFPKEIPLAVNDDTLFYDVDMDTSEISIPGSNIRPSKEVTVTVTNEFLQDKNAGINLKFIKSFN